MPRAATGDIATDDAALRAIAESVRGSIKTVEDMAQAFIREAIQQGVFPPGHRLNLENIATTLGVSRMPVRAGLRQLESEGLLKINTHRGAIVTVLSANAIAEIYEMRILLEGYLIELAIAKLDATVLAELADIAQQVEHAPDLAGRLDARRIFYRRLYELADRPKALQLVEQLRGSVGRYLLLQRLDEHTVHDDLIGLLAKSDVEASKRWIADHLGRVSATMQEMVTEAEQLPGS